MSCSFFKRIVTVFVLFVGFSYAENVGVIGAGYVGLTMSGILSDSGHSVTCVEIDQKRINQLKNSKLYLYEQGLDKLLFEPEGNNTIRFTDNIEYVKDLDVVFICTNTPSDEQGNCDCSSIKAVIKSLLNLENCPSVICIKSTVAPGSMLEFKQILLESQRNDIQLVYNPEFMREGTALADVRNSNPIVIGGENEKVLSEVEKIYSPLLNKHPHLKLIKTSPQSAELIKYGWNGFSALRITYVNELNRLCNNFGANISEVLQGVSMSESLLPTKVIKPGCGYGGSCLPKDTLGLSRVFEKCGIENTLIHQTIRSNIAHILSYCNKIDRLVSDVPKTPTIAVLGLSFKANTNDIRNAPSLIILEYLLNKGYNVQAYDPCVNDQIEALFPEVTYFDSPYDAVESSDCTLVLTEWASIKEMSLEKIAELVAQKNIVDARGVFDKKKVDLLSFKTIFSETPN